MELRDGAVVGVLARDAGVPEESRPEPRAGATSGVAAGNIGCGRDQRGGESGRDERLIARHDGAGAITRVELNAVASVVADYIRSGCD